MYSLNPIKKELPREPVEIHPGILSYRNDTHPAWTNRSNLYRYDYGTRLPYVYYFAIVKCGNFYEIDILEYPDMQGRDESSSKIHWLYSSRGGKKICISSGKEPTSLEAAESILKGWAHLITVYIMTGVSPDQQINNHSRR